MRELAKMATGLAARSGIGPWLRTILFAGMVAGVWQLWLWIADHTCGESSDFIIPAAIGLAIVNFMVVLIGFLESGLADHGLRHMVQWLPLALWAEMTDNGEDVRLWAILIWPFLVPAELAVCVGTAVAAVAYGASRILNIRLK